MHLRSASTVTAMQTQSSDVNTLVVPAARSLVSSQPSPLELPSGTLSQPLLSIKSQAAPEDTLANEGRHPYLRELRLHIPQARISVCPQACPTSLSQSLGHRECSVNIHGIKRGHRGYISLLLVPLFGAAHGGQIARHSSPLNRILLCPRWPCLGARGRGDRLVPSNVAGHAWPDSFETTM